ncbi:asparaginase [Motilibacter peucedani]|uniref:Asparaginase n=1 Tax=Motilibacter peucedani TaxID=598650 RepID=A0A420XTL5_9ACTN|nr:asparaginase [Motilibacter peucedani]RKS80202.1 asparaginase [Motilibacter peucedani]
MSTDFAPVARVIRSGFVEGVHVGAAVVVDPDGTVVASLGKPGVPVLPRSAAKPLQSVAMLRAGLDLPPDLLALATASHSGEAEHLDGVRRILALAGLAPEALQGTPDLPLGRAERRAWQQRGDEPSSLAQNCSGQHAAMLLTCVGRDWPTDAYLASEHPLQQEVARTVAELGGTEVVATAVDGCGAPTLALPLAALARAFGRIASAGAGSVEGRVADAVQARPDLLGGSGREVTRLLRAVPGLLAKDGAEGVFAAAVPGGPAVALKVGDGGARAVWPVAVALLRRAGVRAAVLDELAEVTVLGHGEVVGSVQPVALEELRAPA